MGASRCPPPEACPEVHSPQAGCVYGSVCVSAAGKAKVGWPLRRDTFFLGPHGHTTPAAHAGSHAQAIPEATSDFSPQPLIPAAKTSCTTKAGLLPPQPPTPAPAPPSLSILTPKARLYLLLSEGSTHRPLRPQPALSPSHTCQTPPHRGASRTLEPDVWVQTPALSISTSALWVIYKATLCLSFPMWNRSNNSISLSELPSSVTKSVCGSRYGRADSRGGTVRSPCLCFRCPAPCPENSYASLRILRHPP